MTVHKDDPSMLGVPKEAEHCRAWRIPATKPRRDIDLLLARQPSKYRRVIVGVALVRVGHERGAFTGAVDKRVSPFVEADGGTIFLDELGELPVDLQPKLLRALSERRIKSVGARKQVVPLGNRSNSAVP